MGRLLRLSAAASSFAASVYAQAPTSTTVTFNGQTETLTPGALESWKEAHKGKTSESPYGYTPSLSSTVAYTVVFSLLTIVHLVSAIKFKYASAIGTMVVGGILEIIGWAGRLWSNKNILLWDPFIMQTCCLIIGPVFFSAWDYTLLGFCIRYLGSEYSSIPPNAYIIIFVAADIISSISQAVGGGGAAVAAQDYKDTTESTHIMSAGISFQLATTTIFVVLAIDFIVRVMFHKPYPAKSHNFMSCKCLRRRKNKTPEDALPTSEGSSVTKPEGPRDKRDVRKAQILLAGVAWATLMIYIRGIYRSVELAQGWSGYVITHEVYFIWLDGFIMVLCMAGLAVTHPGFLLPNDGKWK